MAYFKGFLRGERDGEYVLCDVAEGCIVSRREDRKVGQNAACGIVPLEVGNGSRMVVIMGSDR